MSRRLLLLSCWLPILHSETITLTMKQAVNRALQDSPDIALARIDEQRAALNIRIAKDPFSTKIGAGSGLAYTNGYPLSIDNSGPTIIQARASRDIYNKPQSYRVAEARENARTAAFATGSKSDEVAFRVVSLYLDADRARRLSEAAAREVEELTKVSQAVAARVEDGRELPIENSRANVNILEAKQRLASLADDQDLVERQLAVALGRPPEDRVRTTDDGHKAPELPSSEAAALETALASNKELKRMQSAIVAKGLEVKSNKVAWYPRIDLVGEYGLFSTYNNYNQYFRQFQANNGEIGMSVQLPILPGPALKAQAALAEEDAAHLQIEKNQLRNQIVLDVHRAFQDLAKAKTSRELAQAELQLAMDQLKIILAQAGEGRVAMRQVEEARFAEDEKWIAFYDADAAVEKAQFTVLKQTGEIVAALQ